MFDRPREFRISGERVEERITLAAGEEQKTRYTVWFKEKMAEPRFCRYHPRTQLVFDREESSIRQAYKNDTRDYRIWNEKQEVEPGAFHFRLALRCPACRCAYALCPPEFHETSFATFNTATPERAATLASAREFATQVNTHECGFALFVGPTGPGKTRLACNIIRELENCDALYVRQAELTIALRATYGSKVVEYDEDGRPLEPKHPLEITQRVRFLVLDEVGCTALANDERLLLDELLKHRYEQRKPTILISNLLLFGTSDATGLKEFLGDALTDRIKEATGNGKFIVQFSGESYRRTIGENYLSGLG